MTGWFYLFFFFSGVTALIYETAFARQLHLIFGSTLSAVSVVLAVFFGGMALGAALLGPRADRTSPLRLYGLLEIGVGLCALLAVILIPRIRDVYAYLYSFLHLSGAYSIILQGVLAALVLLLPMLLMGATLPVLARGLTASLGQRFSRIGGLYGLNTVGAAMGTLLCGFLLLEHLGYFMTVLAAMIANIAIGFFALVLARSYKMQVPLKAVPVEPKPGREKRMPFLPTPEKMHRLRKLILILAGVSGLAALGYEVVWFRILTFSVVTDAYAFALMLGIYLLGIGLGSLVAARRFRRKGGTAWEFSASWLELGVLEVGVAVVVVVGFAALIWLNAQLPRPDTTDPAFWWKTLRNTSLQALVLVMPATLFLGCLFPILVSLYAASLKRLGGQVGRVAAVNTFGAIVGSLGSGFLLIPLLGIQKCLLLLAGLSAAVGMTALVFGPMRRGMRLGAIVFSLLVLVLCFTFFPIRPHFGFLQIPTHANARLLFYRESSDQTVMVTEDRGGREVRRLMLNQQQATSTSLAGQRKNQLLGHLPLWACPEARTALVICFGSGGTFGALGLYDLDRVDCVEICPAVIEAASYFREWNGDVLSKPHVRVIIDDGRSHLLTTEERYDIITLEPMHPGLKGVTSLYSLEFYQEARRRLKPGGAICQWVPLYSMTGQDARSLIATAIKVFPQSSLWIVGTEGILLCARDSLSISLSWLEERIQNEDIAEALRRVRLDDPWAILSGYLLGPEGLEDFTKGAPIIRDDRPFTEYSIPRHQHLFPWDDILALGEQRESPLPLIRDLSPHEMYSFEEKWEERKSIWIERDRGFAAYSQGDYSAARRHLEAAYSQNPEDRYAVYFLKELYWRYGLEFSRRELWSEAVEAYQRASLIEPDDPEAHLYLAVALDNAGRQKESAEAVRIALRLKPDFPEAKRLLNRVKAPR